MKKFYITTAIDYVNAKPHIGHAFEKVLADAIARWHAQKGEKVWFLTGTDENAQKNVQAAKDLKVPVKQFVGKNSGFFIELCEKLNLSNNDFIRTTEERHAKICKEIVKKVYKKGDIYKGSYQGLYCYGCEAYKTEKELVNGRCWEHPNREIVELKEEAYFFKLSKYKKQIEKFVKECVVPESRGKEILNRLNEEDLKDLCITRKGSDWGIDFPLDKSFKIYVWFDALVNYISGASGNWPADLHVIGKGINWFHSVIWPAILLSADYELPKNILVHEYLNLEGQKMSKSLGNVIDPLQLIEKYGTDSVRYSLLKCSVFADSDFNEEIVINRNNELADKLGNLVSRVAVLIEKYGTSKIESKLLKKIKLKEIEKHFNRYETDKVLSEIFAFIDLCNEYISNKKPWETHDKKVLYELKESILKIAELLFPFIPENSEKITKQFSAKNIKKQEILFKKI